MLKCFKNFHHSFVDQHVIESPFIWLLLKTCFYLSYFSVNCLVEELSIEQEAERKIGWFLKLLFAGTATVVAYQFFPYMGMVMSTVSSLFSSYFVNLETLDLYFIFSGDNLLQQSVSLLQVKDPLFKRMGASRLTRFAIDGSFHILFLISYA